MEDGDIDEKPRGLGDEEGVIMIETSSDYLLGILSFKFY